MMMVAQFLDVVETTEFCTLKDKFDFWTRWRCKWTHCASSHNQKKDNNKFKNEKQPELPEN